MQTFVEGNDWGGFFLTLFNRKENESDETDGEPGELLHGENAYNWQKISTPGDTCGFFCAPDDGIIQNSYK